jgi:predicted metal-dependent hydrolase
MNHRAHTYQQNFRKYATTSGHNVDRDDRVFVRWMQKVEEHVKNKTGIALIDLPDEMYRTHHEDNLDSENMADIVLKNNRYLFSIVE